ncbi:MAG: DUF4363 family protein [Oscillospiraceae bacterium]|nr:DUF4363 family protein [Oscillospiraceae bacterium]
MKRVVFAGVLLVFLIGFNLFCLKTVTEIKEGVFERIDFLKYTIKTEDSEKIASECEKFTEYWLSRQHILCRIVRHELLDETAIAVSRFSSLAQYGEYGELSAEADRCRILMEEIWDSELPLLRNIL